MKKFLIRLTSLIAAVAVTLPFAACSCGGNDTKNEEKTEVWGTYSTAKVGQSSENNGNFVKTAARFDVQMMKNETEGGQIIITAAKDYDFFDLEISACHVFMSKNCCKVAFSEACVIGCGRNKNGSIIIVSVLTCFTAIAFTVACPEIKLICAVKIIRIYCTDEVVIFVIFKAQVFCFNYNICHYFSVNYSAVQRAEEPQGSASPVCKTGIPISSASTLPPKRFFISSPSI